MFIVIRDEGSWQDVHGELPGPKTLAHHTYVAAAAGLEKGGTPELAIWNGKDALIAHPYIRRSIPGAQGFDDLRSAYEFGGFWCCPRSPDGVAAAWPAFSQAFADYCRDQGIVSEFVRFHPFIDRAPQLDATYVLSKHADNVVVPLDRPYEEIFAAYHPSKRKQVRQGRRHQLRMSSSDRFDEFVRIYHDNLDRLGASEFYYFPLSFFAAVHEFLDLRLVHDRDGTVCAAHCYLRDGEIVHAFLCHARHDKLALRPNDFAYDGMIGELCGGGARRFHFGGGAPSLAAYKRQFSPLSVSYHTGTRVFLPDVYDRLTAYREAETGKRGNPSGFFPAYRAG